MFDINAQDATDVLTRTLKKNLVPFIVGSPGVGKSDIVKNIAKQNNLELIDIRLSQCDPTDLQGFPNVVDGRMRYIPPANFPLDTDELPKGKDGWLIFLDEMNSAPLSVQAAAYKILLDRMVDNHNIHPRVRLIAAGNKTTDKAIVQRQSTAIQSRLIHFSLAVDHEVWIDWANQHDIDHRVISYIKWKPNMLQKFDPNHADNTFPCPRTWEFLSKLINGVDAFGRLEHVMMAGTVGEGASTEFKSFVRIYESLPTIEQILNDPTGFIIPNEADKQYAITTMLSHNMHQDNINILMKAVKRLPIEFQVVTLKDIYKRVPELKSHELIQTWIAENAHKMF